MKKSFRLFKRSDDGREMPATAAGFKDRDYYFRFTHKGRCYVRCLETNDATKAQARAKAKYQEITQAVTASDFQRLDATKLRHDQLGTVAELLACYRAGPAEASAQTRQANICAMLLLLGGSPTQIREINAAAATAYFERVTVKALAEPDQQKAASLRRSANSIWSKAKSLFTAKCVAHYRTKNLYHGCLQEFVAAGEMAKFSPRSIPKVAYNPPADDIIQHTLAAWEGLAETNRDLFLSIGHALAFGLRAAEFAQARWEWHQIRGGYPVLDGSATVKAGSGIIQVRALDPWFSIMWREIQARQWRTQPHDYIIPGSDSYRTDALFRAASDWLRRQGWETQKTNHALRAYAGAQVAMKYGIYEAQMFLRHASVKVTEQSYSHFIKRFRPSDPNALAATWALAVNLTSKVSSAIPDVILDDGANLQKTPEDSGRITPIIVAPMDATRHQN